MQIGFDRPLALLLLPVVAAFLFLTGRHFRMADKGKKIKYLAFRSVLMLLLVLALSGLKVSRVRNQAATIFLVDVSDSMTSHGDEISQYLANQIRDMPEKNRMAIVAFGGDAKVEQFLTEKQLFSGFGTTPVRTSTNIENAISAAMALYPDDAAKRMVLITDGVENEGSMQNMSSTLQSNNISFEVLKFQTEMGEEVYVDDLNVPDSIRVGDQYAITVKVKSNVETDAELLLYCGRSLKGQENVKLSPGENQFVFYDEADETGFRNYRVSVNAAKDTVSLNNEYVTYAQIASKDKVLVIEGEPNEGDSLKAGLDAAGVDYDCISTTAVPTTINEMLEYKSIVLLNVYYDDLREGFVSNIKSYVKDYAGGLIAVGGDNSFALGAYRDTVLEEILPVDMDLEGERQIPKMEMIMVIDHSGSMSCPANDGSGFTGLDLAKAAAIKAIDNLRKTDNLGVLAFDDTYTWVIEPQPAEDKDALATSVGKITDGGGTCIYPAVEEAVQRLSASDAKIKHIVLLTDGQDTYRSYDPLLKRIAETGITLSAVAVGADADVSLMKGLANACGGRYYYTDINEGLPRIFAKEVFLSTKEYLINETFTPAIAANNEMIKTLADGAPSLLGYIATSPKPTATNVLVSHKDDPVLATWQYGLGRTVAWCSDVSGKWSGNWTAWDGYPQFWKNVIDYTIADTALGDDKLDIATEGSHAVVSYETQDYGKDTKVVGVCTDENGNTKEIAFDVKAPGKYEAKVDMDEVGVYNIALKNQRGDDVVKSVNTAAVLQYSAEYRFYDESESLSKMLALTGGKELTLDDKVFRPIDQSTPSKVNITNLLLILALALFMLDVLERRLNLAILSPLTAAITKRAMENAGKTKQKRKRETKQGGKSAAKEKAVTTTEPAAQEKAEQATDGKLEKAEQTADGKSKKTEKTKGKKQTKEAPKTLDTNALLQKKKDRNSL